MCRNCNEVKTWGIFQHGLPCLTLFSLLNRIAPMRWKQPIVCYLYHIPVRVLYHISRLLLTKQATFLFLRSFFLSFFLFFFLSNLSLGCTQYQHRAAAAAAGHGKRPGMQEASRPQPCERATPSWRTLNSLGWSKYCATRQGKNIPQQQQ